MSGARAAEREIGPGRFKPYPVYKGSGVEWLREIPAHWEVKRFKAILVRNDSGAWGEDFDDDGTIVLRSTEQTADGRWNIESPARRRLTAREISSTKLQVGDLVVTKSSGSELHIGKTSIVDQAIADLGCCFSNFMQRLRVGPPNQARYFWYLLNSPVAREQLVFLSSTTTGLGNLDGPLLGAIRVPLGPAVEQRAIAAFLDSETAKTDALAAKKERLIKLLKEKRTALITQAVTNGLDPNVPMKDSGVEWLGRIPAQWEVKPLKRAVRFLEGPGIMAADFVNDGIPLLRIAGIGTRKASLDGCNYLLPALVRQKWEHFRVRNGDLLISGSASTGFCSEVDTETEGAVPYTGIIIIRPYPGASEKAFLRWFFVSGAFLTQAELARSGTAIQHFGPSHLSRMRMIVPPLPEQRAIAAFLDRETAKIDALIAKVHEGIQRLKEYRTALISAAVTGKVDVREEVT